MKHADFLSTLFFAILAATCTFYADAAATTFASSRQEYDSINGTQAHLERRFFNRPKTVIPDCDIFVRDIAPKLGLSHTYTKYNCCKRGIFSRFRSEPPMIKCNEAKNITELNLKQKLPALTWGRILSGHTGTVIPTELSKLSKLVILDLSNNHLEGRIPTELGLLSTIKVLDLSRNSLTGTIPSTLAQLTTIDLLRLNDNGLDGIIPWQISRLTAANILNFQNNYLMGIPTSVVNLRTTGVIVKFLPQNRLLSTQASTSNDPSALAANVAAINHRQQELKEQWKSQIKAQMKTLPSDAENECSICLDKMMAGNRVWEGKACKHQFHEDCALSWIADNMKTTCPLCRQHFV